MKLVGYISNGTTIDAAEIAKFTHIVCNLVHSNSTTDPTIVLGYGSWSWMQQAVSKAHSVGIKALLALFTNGSDYPDFANIVSNSSLLSQFVTNICNVITSYGFDGVAVDWESCEPQSSMSTLLASLGPAVHALPGGKEVTAATSWYRFDVSLAMLNAGYIDYVMVMCYDLWSYTIPRNGCGDPGWNPAEFNGYTYTTTGAKESYADTVGIIGMYLSGGFPGSKIIVSIEDGEISAAAAGQIAQWVAQNGLGGCMLYNIPGDTCSQYTTAINSAFASAPPANPPSTSSSSDLLTVLMPAVAMMAMLGLVVLLARQLWP